jgi:hypothetical protein
MVHGNGSGDCAGHRGDRAGWKLRRAGEGAACGGATRRIDGRRKALAQNAARRAQTLRGDEAISTRVVVEDVDDGIDLAVLDDSAPESSIIDAARARSSGWGRRPYGGSIIAPRLRFWRRFG